MFLEELPAEVTRHLLAQLTPEGAPVGGLLGYPKDRSDGATALRRRAGGWTIAQVLDYIATAGQRDAERHLRGRRSRHLISVSIRALLWPRRRTCSAA
jgi:hypothetical protein